MLEALGLLVIEIDIDPEIREIGGLLLTWHGVFTAVGIAVGVYTAVLVARRLGFIDDDVYSAALIAIPFGIVGARALFVIERWGSHGIENVIDIFRINEGGISIYGAVLGGLVGGLLYGFFRRLPIRRGLDVTAFGLVIGLAVGRIGDIINGEHFAEPSSLPWALKYTNLNSPSVLGHPECGLQPFAPLDTSVLCAQHPAVAYEMIGLLLIFGLLFLVLRYLKRDGFAFFSFLLLYALLRFGVSELRLDSREVIAGLTTPQVTSLFLIPVALAGLLYSWRRPVSPQAEPRAEAPLAPAPEPSRQ
jgi:phosphatidylglycerol:prolipoprotein diacylglycerol transferase